MRYTRTIVLFLLVQSVFINNVFATTNHEINVSGAGPSTNIVTEFFSAFTKHNPEYSNIKIIVPPRSIKHAGGIRWSNKHLFGRTGRALNANEKLTNKQEILLAKIQAVFVKGSKVDIHELSVDQLSKIYQMKITNWNDLGGPDATIALTGREPKEAIHTKLKQLYPFMKDFEYRLTFTRDHHIQGYINSTRGNYGLAFGAKPNFSSDSIIKIPGKQTGVSVGLVYDLKNQNDQLLIDVKTFSKTEIWKNIVKSNGYLVIK